MIEYDKALSPEEILALAKGEGYKLSDEDLETAILEEVNSQMVLKILT